MYQKLFTIKVNSSGIFIFYSTRNPQTNPGSVLLETVQLSSFLDSVEQIPCHMGLYFCLSIVRRVIHEPGFPCIEYMKETRKLDVRVASSCGRH